MEIFLSCLLAWLLLGFTSLALIRFRVDAYLIEKDINVLLTTKFPNRLISYFLLYFILPFSLPFHIVHLIRYWNDFE